MMLRGKTLSLGTLLSLSMLVLSMFAAPRAGAGTAYNQPPDPAGGQYKSAWYSPDGLDDDQYVWDAFTLASNTAITEVQWRGAYTNYLSGAGKAPVYDFTVAIYGSAAANTEPDVTHAPLVRYHTNNNAGETLAGTFGGVLMYDYHFTLPSPFQAVAGTKYWVQIEAYQGLTPTYYWPPDWSIAKGTGGDGSHFRRIGGTGGMFNFISGDCAFMLLTSGGPTWTINASASPGYAGSVQGAGVYPANSQVTLVASAAAGYGFVNWTEGATQVSTSATYKFTATKDRTLVANFVPAYPVTTSSMPLYGGTTSGGGTFNSGKSVTVTATPRQGYVFQDWTFYGTVVGTSASYTFTVTGPTPLQANFVPGTLTIPFDLDHGEPPPMAQYTSTPFDLTVGGVTAHFWSPQDGYYGPAFSLQSDGTTWGNQTQLDGNYLWPDSVYRNDLVINFSQPVTAVSLDFATVEMESWADSPSPLVLTAYNGSTSNPPVGSAQASGVYGLGTTYPEGVLVFTSATPFNVIKLTVGPNQWGTNNFMADNISATIQCSSLSVTSQPAEAATCPRGGAAFGVGVSGAGTPAYRWQRETAPGSGQFVDLDDGPTVSWDGAVPGLGAIVSGALTDTLLIAADSAGGNRLGAGHAIRYRCGITNPCSSAASEPAQLTVCPADFDCSGFVDIEDYTWFVLAFEAGTDDADFDGSGFVDTDDFDAFVLAFEAGC